jgi:hypothetical protein
MGDVIIDLDGHDVSKKNADAINEMLKGPPNSPVTMILTRISPVYAAQGEEQVSFGYNQYPRSLLPLYWVSFASTLVLF